MEELETSGVSKDLSRFRYELYKQARYVEWAKLSLRDGIAEDSKYTVSGHGIHEIDFEVDDRNWREYNHEYYKLKEIEYKGMHEIPELIMLRSKVTGVVKTAEFMEIKNDWKEVTMMDSHKNVVKHQAELLLQMVKAFHITEADKKLVSPQNSPVVYDVMHAIYIYFKAVGDGDLEPMLDFMIDGKYADAFKKEVGPPNKHVLKSETMDFDNLYLF